VSTHRSKILSTAVGLAILFQSTSLQAPPPAGANTGGATLAPLLEQARDMDPKVLRLALDSASWAWGRGIGRDDTLTVIDYSKPSTEPRMWVFDLKRKRLIFEELVAHGKGSGGNVPTRFSNTLGSRQSSLGLFVTAETYQGQHGYSLRLQGLEPGINDLAYERNIVFHAADYVSEEFGRRYGRLGLSWGCPALRPRIAPRVIDLIKGGSLVFAYYPDTRWFRTSPVFRAFRVAAAGL
jgi:hypothetical protein